MFVELDNNEETGGSTDYYLANIYLFKVNNRGTKKRL